MNAADVEKVLIFTGAGISVPLGLPTTAQFMAAIRDGQLPVTRQICEYLAGATKSSRGEDVEWILGELERFSSSASFIEQNLRHLAGGNSTALGVIPIFQGAINSWKTEARNELIRIKKIVHKKLQSYNSENALQLYTALIKQLKKKHPRAALSVVTTNYDLTFDEFVEEVDIGSIGVKGFNDSFRGGKYNRDETFNWDPEVIEYLKIHGSLDWHINEKKCSRSGIATTPDNPDDLPILYPGFKGSPSKEPFISLHGKLARRVNEAQVVYVVGFAFRDDYINTIFENALGLRSGLTVYHVNPAKMEDYPEESLVPKFKNRFSNFQLIQKGIEVTESPLPI